jgi:hypothetical protein
MIPDSVFTPLQQAQLKYIGAVVPDFILAESKTAGKVPRPSPKEIFETLREETLKNVSQKNSLVAFKMSGGLDSRILAFILKDIWNDIPFEVHIVKHPKLAAEEDADVVLAKETLNFLGFKGPIVVKNGSQQFYLQPFRKGITQITGVYATELLGGLMFEVLPVVQHLKKTPLPIYLDQIPSEHRQSIETIIRNYIITEDTDFFCQVFLNSPQSTIYGYEEGSWSQPSRFKKHCLAPFSFDPLVERISKIDAKDLKEYSFYHKVFSLLPQKYKEIPLCSDYTKFKSHPFPYPSHLKNAKTIQLV